MEKEELNEIMSHIDIVDMMIYEKEAKELVAQGKTEDALAYAMAMGTRLGWKAYKKKVEEEK